MILLPFAAINVDAPERVSYWSLGALVLMLTGMLVLGIFAAMRLRRKLRSSQAPNLEQDVAWYQTLLQRGALSPQEYQRIMAILAEKDAGRSSSETSSHIQRLDDRGPKF